MFVAIDPRSLSPSQMYDLLVGTIQPRPIAFVSSLSLDGAENLAPFSFFMAGGANPPSLMYSPTLNVRGEAKDSLRNVSETGEFVVNIVTREMAEAMNSTAFDYPAGFSEWPIAGLTPVASSLVKPRRVQESPVSFECRLFKIVSHGEGPSSANYVIGEIVLVHALEELWTGKGLNMGLLRPISRLGGREYLDTEALEIFEMARPTNKDETSVE
ncbi:MAG: flavin reductase family protein [Fimbriimonadaceae bacterium]